MDLETLAVELESQSANGHVPDDAYPVRRIKDAYVPDKQDWIIQDTYQAVASGYLYGPHSSAKSGLVSETAMRMAYALDWFGKKLKDGCVAIVAGEGDADIMLLIRAFRMYYQSKGLTLPVDNDNLLLIPEGVAIDKKDSVLKLGRTLNAWLHGRKLRLLVFDTLATCLDEADETKNADMMRVNRYMRKLQRAFGCSTLIVHHTGKDASKGMRGASDLPNSADMVMKMEEDGEGLYIVTVEKIKGKKKPAQPMYFRQHIVELDTIDNFGDKETGYVLLPETASASTHAQQVKSNIDILTSILQCKGELKNGDWMELCKAQGVTYADFNRTKNELVRHGRVTPPRKGNPNKGESAAAKYYSLVDLDALAGMPTGDTFFGSDGSMSFRSE